MQGRVTVMLRGEVHLRNARKRMINILTKCHGKFALPPDVNSGYSAFANLLATNLSVKQDSKPLSGEPTRW